MTEARAARRLIAGLALALALTACDSLDTMEAPVDQSMADRPVDPIAIGAQTYGQAIALLTENYASGVESTQLFAAGQRGAWLALAQAGVLARDFDVPPVGGALAETAQSSRARYRQIAGRYASKIDPSWLAHRMIGEAAASLDDCHTGFLSALQVREQTRRLAGNARFGGVGVLVRRTADNRYAVIEVFADGPAAQAGLRRGDSLIAVDGEPLTELGIDHVVARVRGPEGSTVRLTIARPGQSSPFDVTLTRGQIVAPSVESRMVTATIGYVHVYGFTEALIDRLDRALADLDRQGARAVILDLRDNGGGQLDVITRATSRFIRDGALFQSIARDGKTVTFRADGSYWLRDRPLVVLTNNGTASGAEILASALKEHRLAIAVGARTAGCVSTGQVFPLADGTAIEIATTRVVTGIRSAELNKVGVQPHITVDISLDDLAEGRDPQMDRAIAIIEGR
ncbi:MAG: S41 family peptidase [Chloroflexota bacterium]|nr:MAG: S41 family peptidase [Chloroflexota bacterium]